MKKAIVTTTINPPTEALHQFAQIAIRDGWTLIIVGDQKTPHTDYDDFVDKYEGAVEYIGPAQQELISQELSDAIGWNCIQRRNFGLLIAWRRGAEIIATVDDDNVPYKNWGKNCVVNTEVSVLRYETDQPVFDPVGLAFPNLWHRGFPLQLLDGRKYLRPQLHKGKVLVQADMWDGSPDVDAVCRITLNPMVTFNPNLAMFGGNVLGPFNSQNTFLSREVLPTYFLFPGIGRMDDIWASYITQLHFGHEAVAYCKASVYQLRNEHDLVKDLDAELLGYHHSLDFILAEEDYRQYLPEQASKAYDIYQKLFKEPHL